MNLLELLRTQARRYRCPVCGTNMADCDIAILTQQGNRALVRVTCASCKDENLLQIVLQDAAEAAAGGAAAKPRPTIDEGLPEVAEPISADELLDLHAQLERHDGGLAELFRR